MTKFVERPPFGGRRKYDYDAIIATATNGKAIELPMAPRNRGGSASNMAYVVGRRGYRLHSSYDARREILTVWCEKSTPDTA